MGKIFISAGHFVNDGGANTAIGTTEAREMILTRDLIVAELKSRGFKEGDDFESVSDTIDLRPTINWINARAVNGDVALEIHGNAYNRQVRGAECFYIAGNTQRQQDGRQMLDALLRAVPELQDRGSKPDTLAGVGSLAFCRDIRISSLLLELCFVDQIDDMNLLKNKRQDFAKGIVDGLIAWSGIDLTDEVTLPIIDIEINGEIYEDKGIIINNNSLVPIDIINALDIDLPGEISNLGITRKGGVLYVLAVNLQKFHVSVNWNGDTRTVILKTSGTDTPIDQIMGNGRAAIEELTNFLQENNSGDFANRFPDIAELYVEEAKVEGVNHDIAFCQMCLETGYLRFGGDVTPEQNNFAGIGTIGGGVQGAFFSDARIGVKAHIQHLKAYASTLAIKQLPIVDPRFDLVKRGVAPTLKQLSKRWAVDSEYGNKILSILNRLYDEYNLLGNNGIRRSPSLGIPIKIPEEQVSPPYTDIFLHSILGRITITGGFMEPYGHSWKPELQAIFLNGRLRTLIPSNRNIGIDYSVDDYKVIAWYGGKVIKEGTEGGYGNRIHIQLNVAYQFQGKNYQVYQAYAHNEKNLVTVGQTVKQGEQIAIMGMTGLGSGPHVDLSTYIYLNGSRVELNPQALDQQLD
ncbi:MAG: peptidoglycan DD-metalloendopeptidase family protein [Okeania sp. SIO3I5]|uniref:hormogonium tapered terminus morphoprotein TftA n=1 Tax=Okeania sp. SIO3I5 TaxID=2607805 RepID=UPI0013BAB8DF|nr:N-acetylmuramoyl-L-alanine amidase [Okeania sp. SIO3I5]NEQ40151.1 peptidoglycan DD-metalloendopeptidase family protein [Okeania sp. SIO3I5]